MKMKRFLKYFILILVVISCSKENGNSDKQNTPEFDRSTVLVNLADNIIIPNYNAFQGKMNELKSSSEKFISELDSENTSSNYDDLHNKWVEAYMSWQKIEIYDIGKSEEIYFKSKMNTYPADHSRIENNISTGTYDIENPNNYACQGFPSIDYMIHGIDNDKEKIILKYRENEKYGQYLQDIIKEMDENTTEVVSSWSNFRSTFVNSYENTATSMFNMLTNDFVYYFEKGLRTNKIGIASGVFSNEELPNKIEAYYSSLNAFEPISKKLLIEALNSVENFFIGKSSDGLSTGSSFKTYLDYLRSSNNNGEENTDLGQTILTKIETARNTINNLDDNFIDQINNDNIKMLQAFDALQVIVVHLKVDMLQAFNVNVDYVDADGD